MGKVFYIFVMVTLCATVRVHSLECYVCSNCAKVSANDLKSCDATVTTTSAPSNATTSAPTNVTTAPANATSTTSTPTNATSAPENATTTTSAPTNATSASENVTTTTSAPTNATSITENGTITTNATSAPENTNTTTNASDPIQLNRSVQRKRRSAEDRTSSNKGCICENGNCECTGNHFFRAADITSRAVTYQCYKHVKTVDGEQVVDRGCQGISDGSGRTACDVLNITDCEACGVDKCNSALPLQIPIALVVSAFCLSFI